MPHKKRKLAINRTITDLWRVLNCRCYLCGEKLSKDSITKDHVFPKSSGYSLSGNAMPAHKECNRDKGDTMPSIDLIAFACETYDKAGMFFDPRTRGQLNHGMYKKVLHSMVRDP